MKRKVLLLSLLMASVAMMGQSKLSTSSRLLVERVKNDTTIEARNITRSVYPMSYANDVDYVNAFIYLEKKANLANLEALGVYVENEFGDIITARIPVNMLEQVAELADVKYVEVGTSVTPKMSKARVASHVAEVHQGESLSRPFYGEGVVVGVVDYGFQYDHINFYEMGGDSLRVKRVWNQNVNGAHPAGYSIGREYKTQAEILAAKYDDRNDEVGHGCHVAGIAAGSDTIGGFQNYGVAPKSDLVFVSYSTSGLTDNVAIANGVKYVFDYATSVNKPAVVNLSLGSHSGPHDGTSTFDKLIDQMTTAEPGRIVVGACGNEGDYDLHLKKSFTQSSTEVKTSLYFAGYGSYKISWLDIWGDPGTNYTVRLAVYNKSTMEETWSTGDIDASVTAQRNLSASKGASGSVRYAAGKESNGKNHVSLDIQLSSLTSGYYIALIISSHPDGVVNAWTDGQYSLFAKNNLTGFVGGNTNSTVGEIGGTATNIIAVGAYSVDNHFNESVGRIASFSSVGPTADGRIKPDVVAPGTAIISSVPNTNAIRRGDSYDNGGSHTVNGTEYLYSYMQGTSMSSPYVTGVVALWLEANPNMGPSRIREILEATSIQDNNTGSCPNNRAGYGKINAHAGILKAIEISGNDNLELLPDAIVAYPNPNNGNFRILLTKNDPNLNIMVYNMNGQVVYSQRVGMVSEREEVAVSMGNVADGAYIIKVVGDNINEAFRLMIKK